MHQRCANTTKQIRVILMARRAVSGTASLAAWRIVTQLGAQQAFRLNHPRLLGQQPPLGHLVFPPTERQRLQHANRPPALRQPISPAARVRRTFRRLDQRYCRRTLIVVRSLNQVSAIGNLNVSGTRVIAWVHLRNVLMTSRILVMRTILMGVNGMASWVVLGAAKLCRHLFQRSVLRRRKNQRPPWFPPDFPRAILPRAR